MVHIGEIYNHQELRDEVLGSCDFDNQIRRLLCTYMKNLDMIFAICWMATLPSFINGDDFMAARDPLGVKYYYGFRRARPNVFFF
jgi:asparagine synthase (glutamine-hydrolysing)